CNNFPKKRPRILQMHGATLGRNAWLSDSARAVSRIKSDTRLPPGQRTAFRCRPSFLPTSPERSRLLTSIEQHRTKVSSFDAAVKGQKCLRVCEDSDLDGCARRLSRMPTSWPSPTGIAG